MAPSTLIGSAFFASAKVSRPHAPPACGAIHAGFARQFKEPRGARILGVIAMTKSRHAFARFLHLREMRVAASSIEMDSLTARSAIFFNAGRNLQSRRRDAD